MIYHMTMTLLILYAYVYIGAYIFKAYTNGHPYDTSQVNQTDIHIRFNTV